MKEYETYEANLLKEDEEIDLEIIDRETLERFRARVLVAKEASQLPEADRLWVRHGDLSNVKANEAWGIRILSRVEDDFDTSTIKRTEVPLSERRGYMLRSLLLEQQKREEEEATGDKQ